MPRTKKFNVKAGETTSTVITSYFTKKGLEPFRTTDLSVLDRYGRPLTLKITIDYDLGANQQGTIQYVMAKIEVNETTGRKEGAVKTLQFNLPAGTNAHSLDNLLTQAGFGND